MNVTERINRILFIMSYVSQHQGQEGVPMEDLARAVGISARQLEREFDFMLLIGKPPFRPDDYVDIFVDEDNRVWIDFDQMLNRPVRFTRPEAMAMALSLQLLDPEVDPETVTSLRGKIERAIAASADPSARLEDRVRMERRPVSELFLTLSRAVKERRKIRIKYYTLGRDKTSWRVVRPYTLIKHQQLGFWYLIGYAQDRRDVRTFRFERILDVELSDETFRLPEDFDLDRYKADFLKPMGRHKVEIHLSERILDWAREEWGEAIRDEEEGEGGVLTLSSETYEFPSRVVLQYAPDAKPLSPPEFVEKVRQDAQAIISRYEDSD
ncbi:MAG TPA: WYL domain-containing protein [Acidobacteriota bacterium]|nr:WYL domain-containing protein [Acidobacteriota bacterium]